MASGDRESGGGGSTAERVIKDVLEGKVDFTIGVVICNNPPGTVGVYPKVEALNKKFNLKGDDKIDVVTINSTDYPAGFQRKGATTLEESSKICRVLEERSIGFVSMEGYMKILTGEFVEEWGWEPAYGLADPTFNGKYHPKARIANNHPSILPFTAGEHGPGAHQKALDLFIEGVIKRTCMTWHLGAKAVDAGAILFEKPVDIYPTDTAGILGDRVQTEAEKPETVFVLDRHIKIRTEHIRVAA